MSKILKRPMFRKGGKVEEGVMSLAAPRKQYQEGTPDPFIEKLGGQGSFGQEVYDLAKEAYGRDIKQERSDILSNLLIRGGLGLVSGEGAGKGTLGAIATAFQKPTEQALSKLQELKTDPARMLTAKTAIAQKGAERLQMLKNQEDLLDAQKKAKVILGPDATAEQIRNKASEILNQQIFGVEERFREKAKQEKLDSYETNYGLTGSAGEEYYQFEKNRGKIEAATGKPVRSFIKGERTQTGKVDYTRKSRNKPDGIYIDPINGVYIEITNGVPTVIQNPLSGNQKVSSIPKIQEEIITEKVVRENDGISDPTYG
jgi:hypothetical protein